MKQTDNRDNIFHERIHLIDKEGYCGFKIRDIQRSWGFVKVTAGNADGKFISASGETPEEAYIKIIDQIDLSMDEMN